MQKKDKITGNEYLFLGSIRKDQKKWLDLKSNTVCWTANNNLQQSGQLTPSEFFDKRVQSHLSFRAEGSEPLWDATISNNTLKISHPG